MKSSGIVDRIGRKTIITGHYGSGKTEFAVSLAMILAKEHKKDDGLALIDLDIINPYFRSREQRDMLQNEGITIYGSAFDTEVTTELPALSASLRAPLESNSCRVIIDVGGNDIGAIVLNQFSKYFLSDTTVLAVVNINRPDTSDLDSVLEHIASIEFITKLEISCVVNNTHLLRETTADDIKRGYDLCMKVCQETGKSLLCSCYPEGIVSPDELKEIPGILVPLGLYMRPTWLDK